MEATAIIATRDEMQCNSRPMRAQVVSLLALAACHHAATTPRETRDPCDVADNVYQSSAAHADPGTPAAIEGTARIAEACRRDGWDSDAIACLARVNIIRSGDECWTRLSATQQAGLAEALGSAGEPSHGSYATNVDATPIDRAATDVTDRAVVAGSTLLSAATYSLVGTSDISFRSDDLVTGRTYVFVLVAERAMTFRAEVRGSAARLDMPVTQVADDVFVRSLRFEWNDADRNNAEVAIHADGSDRGDVRFLLFQARE